MRFRPLCNSDHPRPRDWMNLSSSLPSSVLGPQARFVHRITRLDRRPCRVASASFTCVFSFSWCCFYHLQQSSPVVLQRRRV